LILECASCRDRTLEAMRTQVFANQYIDCTVVLFAHTSINQCLGELSVGQDEMGARPSKAHNAPASRRHTDKEIFADAVS
jgi:hypothetical protein